MAATRLISGSGYGSSYVDSLIYGGRVWDDCWDVAHDPELHVVFMQLGWPGAMDWYASYHGGSKGEITPANEATLGDWNNYLDAQLALNWATQVFMNVCNVVLTPGDDMSKGITLWAVDLGSDRSGSTDTLPNINGDAIWTYFNPYTAGWQYMGFGGEGLNTIIHELGHALGLAHPHDGGNQADASKFPGTAGMHDLGEFDLNQSVYTVMSYNSGLSETPGTLGYGNQGGLGAFDIAALQAIYGARMSTATGDNIYKLPTQNEVGSIANWWENTDGKPTGTGWMCIWDAGGSDTISGEKSTAPVRIDLRAATLRDNDPHAGGYISQQLGIAGGFTIANGVVIENAIGGAGNDTLIGNEVSNKLIGNAGNDILNGEAGADQMVGGAGDDSYYVDDAGDQVVEAASAGDLDEVYAKISYTLPDHVEVLIARDTSAGVNLVGNALNNSIFGETGADTISGGLGNDTLNGGSGADRMEGGAGDDAYHVQDQNDQVIETASGGANDKINTTVSYTLTDYVEKLAAKGTASIGLTGNALNNEIRGNSGANKVSGGLGNDTLYGDKGNDTFVFDTKLNKYSNVDKLADFSVKDDTIVLENRIFTKLKKPGALKKDYFTVGTKAKDKNDYIIYKKDVGLYYDPDGSGSKGKAVLFAKVKGNLSYKDFIII